MVYNPTSRPTPKDDKDAECEHHGEVKIHQDESTKDVLVNEVCDVVFEILNGYEE